tara:strand:+ start:341 stop:3850 length:3510 start_codon:yes stop_codon:yes gene_type:complete
MRLSKIKLAGFKSFVDPTSITFPSSLVGVVGPNGCGKSNVIDAVRWVMGESSATRLRGDSITDVIFNGSSSRKPVGLASVELLFDNSNTTLEGQYAKYSEISIRREVSRDGLSNYYLNGTRCRRKDITGVFLGTGLGPRSYSIIEQGMISRMIEAKPEEMRVFLEEAAGISKYKERRKETSSRIKRTKDNLSRLMDVLDEVEKQIKHLNRQAKTAGRYSQYKNNERRMAAELLALQAKDLEDQKTIIAKDLAEKKISLEAAIADQRSLESSLENARINQIEKTDEFNIIQSRYYKVGSEISRLEQSIEHAKDLNIRQQKDLDQAIIGADEITDHIEQDKTEIEQLDEKLSELTPGLEEARQREDSSIMSFQKAENALSEWQKDWNDHQKKYSNAQQIQTVEMTRIEQIETQLNNIADRINKILEVNEDNNLKKLEDHHKSFSEKELEKRENRNSFERALLEVNENINKLRDQNKKLSSVVDERLAALQNNKAKYASIVALQKAALGESDKGIKSWLESTGLSDKQKVANKLKVKNGWEKAVETVLGDYLQAVCVENINPVNEMFLKLKNGNITLLIDHNQGEGLSPPNNTLAEKISGAPVEIFHILSNVYVADNLDQAKRIHKSLEGEKSVITIDGIWFSKNWLRVFREKNNKESILAREHQLRELKSEIREMDARYNSAHNLLRENKKQLHSQEEHREKLQYDSSLVLNDYSEISASVQSAKFRLDQAVLRRSSLEEELVNLNEEKAKEEKKLLDSQQIHNQASDLLHQLNEEESDHKKRHEVLVSELKRVREQAEEDRQNVQEIAIQFERRKSSKLSVTSNLERMKSQLIFLQNRKTEIQNQISLSQSPISENESDLKKLLDDRLKIEVELSSSRKSVEEAEFNLRELDQTRLQKDQTLEATRSKVNEVELIAQELRVRQEGFINQIKHTDFEYNDLLNEMKFEISIDSCKENLEKLQKRIERLGPINLAAIDEFKEQSERKEYLDAQLADLNDALSTLEGAIRKIDRETRSKFKDAFDDVNKVFKELFPKLFGGGHAYLELAGDDLLTTGITVMARPPGKRNSTIHLLSGGEKALTAVALVFAIFELNPAPFCMLDEVDAPLDDANVTRFCNIVREMSDKVQFVFITHNKVTMEVARQLLGVTMQEPGVSRLVSVDLDLAVKMAAT